MAFAARFAGERTSRPSTTSAWCLRRMPGNRPCADKPPLD